MFSFADPAQRSKLTPLMGSINADGAADRDSAAFVAWLDARPEVDPSKKMRVGAGASFHVGGW